MSAYPPCRAQRQQGVALITAILVVALATTAAAAMMSRQQLDIRRSANLMEADQIRLYERGMVGWAGQILRRDREQGVVDHLKEEWATLLPPMPVENGQLAGYLEDMQGRFNLNSLLKDGVKDELAVARFRRLLALLGLDQDLATAVVDWLDKDIDMGFPGGAEDYVYLGRQPAYRAANRLMVSPSELLLIDGVGQEQYHKLAPFVAVLPAATGININTASAQVLMSLADGIDEKAAEQLQQGRGEGGYSDIGKFLAQDVFAGREVSEEGLAIGSSYFMATSDISIGRIQQRHFDLLYRNDQGQTHTLMHSVGVL